MAYDRTKRPQGQPTRGKTAPNRLRRLDVWLFETERELLAAPGPEPFVDLGFGRTPRTTLEAAGRFRVLNPSLAVVGVEIDRERVDEAQRSADEQTRFVHGGFNAPVGPARLVRALNVLRQYDEGDVALAWARMRGLLMPGGLLVEGTSDPFGRRMVVHLIRDGVHRVLFSTSLRDGADPDQFPPVLPKSLIHRMVPGTEIHALFDAWRRCWQQTLPYAEHGPRQRWLHTARLLAQRHPGVELPRQIRRGYLLWTPASDARCPP